MYGVKSREVTVALVRSSRDTGDRVSAQTTVVTSLGPRRPTGRSSQHVAYTEKRDSPRAAPPPAPRASHTGHGHALRHHHFNRRLPRTTRGRARGRASSWRSHTPHLSHNINAQWPVHHKRVGTAHMARRESPSPPPRAASPDTRPRHPPPPPPGQIRTLHFSSPRHHRHRSHANVLRRPLRMHTHTCALPTCPPPPIPPKPLPQCSRNWQRRILLIDRG